MIDKDQAVALEACHCFPLVFSCVTPNNAGDFRTYLQNEISVLRRRGQSLEKAGDPLVSNLNKNEELQILKTSILALGALNEQSLAIDIIHDLMPFLSDASPSLRWAGLTSILTQVKNSGMHHSIYCANFYFTLLQISFVSDNQANCILWSILPSFGDPNPEVREVFAKYKTGSKNQIQALKKTLTPHPEDAIDFSHA